MVKLERTGNGLVLCFSESEAKELGFVSGKEFEVFSAGKGSWLLAEKQERGIDKRENLERDAKIFSLLKQKSLGERVEGKFEKLLDEKEKERFKELLKEGRVILFRLSEKYKKAIYKIAPEKRKESEKQNVIEKPIEEYSLERDGLLVVRNEERAKRLSMELAEEIKAGKIKGLKSFDGSYYIIETELLQKYYQPVKKTIQASKGIFLPELQKKAGVSRLLTKIVCEFLKEDGEVIEKRKELYQTV